MPLLVLYEVLAWALSGASAGIRNGADVLLKSLFALFGPYGLAVFTVAVLGTGVALVVADWRRSGPPERRYFAYMAGESIAYALVFGGITSALTAMLLHGPSLLALGAGLQAQGRLGLSTQIMVSLGAGLYEELLFRVVIVGLLAWGARRILGVGTLAAGVFATILGALIFSAFHYIGPLGDRLELTSFTFRAIAGVLLSGLYLTRGFGIAAWTHALYDVFLTLRGF